MNPGVPIRVPAAVSCPDDGSCEGQHWRRAEDLGDTPVEHQHFAEAADHHVRRLEIAMHHAGVVRESDGLRNSLEDSEDGGLLPTALARNR
jgi:hypothetical protein